MVTAGDRVKFLSPKGQHTGTVMALQEVMEDLIGPESTYAIIKSDDPLPGKSRWTSRMVDVIEKIEEE